MIVNQGNLARLYTGFNAAFQAGLGQAENQYDQVAMVVPSATKEMQYGWLGAFPDFREWAGDRVVQNIKVHDYAIKNKSYENTIGVDRDDIEDDTYGIYGPLFQSMGVATAAHPNRLVFDLLKACFSTTCYDGQYFFDTDHPVVDGTGATVSVANTDGGAGTPWFLLDLGRPLKPIIFQRRRDYQLIRMDTDTDEVVFSRKEFRYGVDARVNVGVGLWQTAWGSKQTLDATHFETAFAALEGMKGDHGRPLGLKPTHLVVPPSLRAKGLELLNAERNAAGATNVWRDTAKLLVVPWLA